MVIGLIAVSIVAVIYIAPYFGLDILDYITITFGESIADSTSPEATPSYELDLLRAFDYTGFMIPEYPVVEYPSSPGIDEKLFSKQHAFDCSSCTGCSIDQDTDDYECNSCRNCDGYDGLGPFTNCKVCSDTTQECVGCEYGDIEICRMLEMCIKYYQGDETGCLLSTFGKNTNLDSAEYSNRILNVLRLCDVKDVTVDVGEDIEKRVCTLDTVSSGPNSFSSYPMDSNKPIGSYLSEQKTSSGTLVAETDISGMEKWEYAYVGAVFSKDGTSEIKLEYEVGGSTKEKTVYELEHIKDKLEGAIIDLRATISKIKDEETKEVKMKSIRVHSSKDSTIDINAYVEVFNSSYDDGSSNFRYSKCVSEEVPTLAGSSTDLINKLFYTDSLGSSEFGNVKMVLGNLDTESARKCKFNIYLCSQDVFAEYIDDETMQIFKFMQTFDPSYTGELKNNKFMIYNYFEFDNIETDPENIIKAIEAGYDEWAGSIYPFYNMGGTIEYLSFSNGAGTGNWLVEENSIMEYGSTGTPEYLNCWSSDFYDVNDKDNHIYYDCNGGTCKGKIRVRIGFYYENPVKDSGFRKSLTPIITFCSEE